MGRELPCPDPRSGICTIQLREDDLGLPDEQRKRFMSASVLVIPPSGTVLTRTLGIPIDDGLRSLTQPLVNAMRFAMAAPIDLRNDFDSVSLRRLVEEDAGTRPRAVVCWRWPRSTMVAAGRMRRGSAASVCRSFATGCLLLQRPRTGLGWSMGSHRAHHSKLQRRSPPTHWRRLLRPARSRRSTASCAGGAQPTSRARWHLGDVRHLARR